MKLSLSFLALISCDVAIKWKNPILDLKIPSYKNCPGVSPG